MQILLMQIASCIRLLKSFDAKTFGVGNDGMESENSIWGARRGQVTEQVVEVPLDRQIYDLIDSAGPEGLYMTDVSTILPSSLLHVFVK